MAYLNHRNIEIDSARHSEMVGGPRPANLTKLKSRLWRVLKFMLSTMETFSL